MILNTPTILTLFGYFHTLTWNKN